MGSEDINSISNIMKLMRTQRGGISESSTTSDNTTDFIEIVKKHGIVYNTHHPDYKNVEAKLKIWTQIAEEIGLSVDASKRKWKNLRDSYTKYLRSFRVGTKTSKKYQFWAHAEHMEFLKPYQGPGRSSLQIVTPKEEDDNECDLGYQVLAKASTTNTEEEEKKQITITNNGAINLPLTSSIASMISNYATNGGLTTSGMGGLTMSTSTRSSTAGTMILPVPSLPTVQLPPSLTAKPMMGGGIPSSSSSAGTLTLTTANTSNSYTTSTSLASLTSSSSSSLPSQVFALPHLAAKGTKAMPSSNTASSVGCLIIEPQLFASADTFKKEFNSSSSAGTQLNTSNLQIYPNMSAQVTAASSQVVTNRLNPPLITKIRRVQPSPQSSAINLSFSSTPSATLPSANTTATSSSLLTAYNTNGYTTATNNFMPTIGGTFGGGSTTITATSSNGLAGPPLAKKSKNVDTEISAILQANRDLDANTLFFLSLARSVRSMPTKFQSLAKMRCMRIVSDIELELDNINNDPSDTNNHNTKYCTNNSDSPPPNVGAGGSGVNHASESQSEHFVYVMSPSRVESMIDLSSDEENPQNNGLN